jgi:hypothetical protein
MPRDNPSYLKPYCISVIALDQGDLAFGHQLPQGGGLIAS